MTIILVEDGKNNSIVYDVMTDVVTVIKTETLFTSFNPLCYNYQLTAVCSSLHKVYVFVCSVSPPMT